MDSTLEPKLEIVVASEGEDVEDTMNEDEESYKEAKELGNGHQVTYSVVVP